VQRKSLEICSTRASLVGHSTYTATFGGGGDVDENAKMLISDGARSPKVESRCTRPIDRRKETPHLLRKGKGQASPLSLNDGR